MVKYSLGGLVYLFHLLFFCIKSNMYEKDSKPFLRNNAQHEFIVDDQLFKR
jgi:hypothetical protein